MIVIRQLARDELRRAQEVDVSESGRSEEHTSELQSPYDLVCRLLLEKKKMRLRSPPPFAAISYLFPLQRAYPTLTIAFRSINPARHAVRRTSTPCSRGRRYTHTLSPY